MIICDFKIVIRQSVRIVSLLYSSSQPLGNIQLLFDSLLLNGSNILQYFLLIIELLSQSPTCFIAQSRQLRLPQRVLL